ncbi:MAG: ykuV [Planctomycetaceae bacterium]|nr:ykuV [Planctomycetaceae bacterium]
MMSRQGVGLITILCVVTFSGWQVASINGQDGSASKSKTGGAAKKPATKSSNASKKGVTGKGSSENPFPKRIPSAGLEGGTDWLNTSGEITLKDLRGKIVLLDFWTYCCINCMHILPDLTYLEKKYPNELVVVGVHSGKFNNEKDSENIRRAILRYEIEHPVVNDANMTIWRKFSINTWPSFALIDPEGNFCGTLSGEGNRDNLDVVIGRVVAYHRAKGTLDETPVRFDLEAGKSTATPLRFPGKIYADEAGKRLFISDSNHNRIVVTDLTGELQYVIGSGAIGSQDGAYDVAQFDHPQGMDLSGNLLYVADTENHKIRVVDLEQKQVKTLAGTGKQSRLFLQGGRPLQTSLASPWDVKKVGEKLFIAMAGFHQIWTLNGTESVRVFAGSGKEDIQNGSLTRAALAQPSGITTDGEYLFVVDSEGSAVRKMSTTLAGQVNTLIGTHDLPQGRCLFEFGDLDGVGGQARLQHPLGIAHHKGKLYVADTYNHKIKVVDIGERSVRTLLGARQPGVMETEFSEPAGLSIAGNKLYIADTNNHRIRVYDLGTQKLSTLELTGLTPPKPTTSDDTEPSDLKAIEVADQTVKSGDQLRFQVTLAIPEDFKLNELAPVTYRLMAEGAQSVIDAKHLNQRDEATVSGHVATIAVPAASKTGKGNFQLQVTYSYCRDGKGGVCKFKTTAWKIPLIVAENAEQEEISLQVE